MRMVLSLWSKSHSAYRELLESNLLILLSESTLKINKGYCPKKYSNFYDDFIKNKTKSIGYDNKKVIDYLMCDEMNLKNIKCLNCQKKMAGFTCGSNSLDLKSELRQFLKVMMRNLIILILKKKFVKQLYMSISQNFTQYIMKLERLNYSITQNHYLEMN